MTGNCLAMVTLTKDTVISPSEDYYPGVVKWYDWLLNRSIWKDAFLCKDAEHSLKHGFLKRVDIPGSYFLGAAQMCRMSTSELKQRLPIIGKMVMEDYDLPFSLLTFILVNWGVTPDNKGILKAQTSLTRDAISEGLRKGVLKFPQIDHWPFDNSFSRLTLRRMILNDLVDPPKSSRKKIQFKIGSYYHPESDFRETKRWCERSHLLPYLRGDETPASFDGMDNSGNLNRERFNEFMKYFFTEEPMSFIPNYQAKTGYASKWPKAVEKLSEVHIAPKGTPDKQKQLYINFGVIEEYVSNVIFEIKKQSKNR